jgi:hypothetical protein
LASIPLRALVSGALLLGVASLIGASAPMALAAVTAAPRVPAPQIIVTPIEEP